MRYFVWYYCHLSIPLTHSATSENISTGMRKADMEEGKAILCYHMFQSSHRPGTAVCLRGSRHLLSHQAEGFSQDLPRTSRHWAFLWLIENSCALGSWAFVVGWLVWEDTESPWHQRPCGTMLPCFFPLLVLFFCSTEDCTPSHPHARQVSITELHPLPSLDFYI